MEEIPLPASWPNGADVAVTLSFDVDAEAGWLGEGPAYEHRLTTLSEGRFGVVRGLPRILAFLDREQIPATFYVPGDTAERHTQALKAVVAAGHEVSHHGYLHRRSDGLDPGLQREEVLRGQAALEERLGVTALGYRSPSWELTPETFALLAEAGFDYDSSFMGDDRPYREVVGDTSILEFPIHWSLDDWPYFSWHPGGGEMLAPPDEVLAVWLAEFESAVEDRRHVTYTMHPEVIGRGSRMTVLRRLVTALRERAQVWFVTHGELANLLAGAPRP
jgi:peptidoglycan-N-acetylglucosamine deacetylase